MNVRVELRWLLVGFLLVGCQTELGDGLQFKCTSDRDCSEGYECGPTSSAARICMKKGTVDPRRDAAGDALDSGPTDVDDGSMDVDSTDAFSCPEGEQVCDGTCVDTISNAKHCGACGNACETTDRTHGFAECKAGGCVHICQKGWTDEDEKWTVNGCETCHTRADLLALGGSYACARQTNGHHAVCWGKLEICSGDTNGPVRPDQVKLTKFEALEAGATVTCGVSDDYNGTIACWGVSNENAENDILKADQNEDRKKCDSAASIRVQYTDPTDDQDPVLAVGKSHACALLADGVIRCWGNDEAGQLGPEPKVGLDGGVEVDHETKESSFNDVVAGTSHTCALKEVKDHDLDEVYCWGKNSDGPLGKRPGENRQPRMPRAVEFLPDTDGSTVRSKQTLLASSISAAGDLTCAIGKLAGQTDSGPAIYCWGKPFLSGSDTTSQVFDKVAKDVSSRATLDVGADHGCVMSDGELKCWGKNDLGQLGDGSTEESSSLVDVNSSAQFSAFEVGNGFTCGITKENGYVKCWGNNVNGQLGTGGTTDGSENLPVNVTCPPEPTDE